MSWKIQLLLRGHEIIRPLYTYEYLLTYLLHEAEPFLRS